MDTVDRIYGYFTSKEAKNHPAHNELPNWELLSQTSAFDIKEVKRLYMRYSKICLEDGLISQARFMYMPELANCPFAAMAFNHEMEQARRDHLDFTHFVRILSKLSPKSTAIEKAEYFFDALQIDFGDGGLLERNEVLIMYKNLSGGTLTQPILEKITERVWANLNSLKNHRNYVAGEPLPDGVNRTILIEHLCSLDVQNYLTVQF